MADKPKAGYQRMRAANGASCTIPATRSRDCVTLLEKERITAYFGAGLLYAEPGRTEPLI